MVSDRTNMNVSPLHGQFDQIGSLPLSMPIQKWHRLFHECSIVLNNYL